MFAKELKQAGHTSGSLFRKQEARAGKSLSSKQPRRATCLRHGLAPRRTRGAPRALQVSEPQETVGKRVIRAEAASRLGVDAVRACPRPLLHEAIAQTDDGFNLLAGRAEFGAEAADVDVD